MQSILTSLCDAVLRGELQPEALHGIGFAVTASDAEITERHLAEWIQLAFVSLLAIAAWLRPLSRSRQLMVSKLALIAIGAIVLARLSTRWLTPSASAVLRD